MISTRAHALIDYALVSFAGAMSRTPALPPSVRGLLGVAALGHAGYAALTDYEGGLRPRLTMRQHLALDGLGGAGFCAAALLMRRQPLAARALLLGLGLCEFAVLAASSATPLSGPGQRSGPVPRLLLGAARTPDAAGYPPLDTPKPVADNLFIVDSLLSGLLGTVLPARMTVIRLPDGELLLHSPTRFSPQLKRQLEALGRIRHLVAPNVVHWTFLRGWQNACPEAVTWAAAGLRERSQPRRSGVRLEHDLPEQAPAAWGGVIGLETVRGGLGFREVALFHRPTRTLVLTDLVLNLEAGKLPAPLRPVARAFGSVAPDGMPPPYVRAVIRLRRDEAARAAARLLALQPERVVFAHGRWFETDGAAALRRSLRWLLD